MRLHRLQGNPRPVVIGYAAGLSLLLAALVGWLFVLPEYRPALRSGEVYGIDVSSHQKPLDWRKVYDDDIRFVYVKATEGSSWQDPMFRGHIQGARDAGLRAGAYHYFSLCSPGKTQAANFLRTAAHDDRMLEPVLDLEHSPHCGQRPGREQVYKEIDAYIGSVEATTGKDVMLYVGDDFDRDYGIRQRYADAEYWQLRYLRRPADSHRIWQVGNFFAVDGAPGKVDLNVGRVEEL